MKHLDKIIQNSSRCILWKNIEDFKSQVIWFSDFSLKKTEECALFDRNLQRNNEAQYVVKTTTAVSCKQCKNPFLKIYFSQKSAVIYCELCKKHLLKSWIVKLKLNDWTRWHISTFSTPPPSWEFHRVHQADISRHIDLIRSDEVWTPS